MKQNTTETRNTKSAHLDEMTTQQILQLMHQEDQNIPDVIATQFNTIQQVIETAARVYFNGGKIIYIGAGTSGRLGVLDAAELVPTFNADPKRYFGLIAGGSKALTQAIEGAEDHRQQGADDLASVGLNAQDLVIGIAASGRTPYVIGALAYAQSLGAQTAALSCNAQALISQYADYAIEVPVGPEILTGSTRLKAGTAQKMVLNMISTATMIRIGKVYDNLMIDVQATNEKLVSRAIGIIQTITHLDEQESTKLYHQSHQNIKAAIVMHFKSVSYSEAQQLLSSHHGNVKSVINA
ncbi:N-acetylmuramic acid 6-phosphate etherase [Staphylococcus chromogenes]|uniref:N-acetylmuramic acid 6-phosphate etherase n=1 Tax=Staphylococcus chromogenes TaxID=46126 RepID=UPI0021D35F57|nr:N-acetylmuramic acid 6-phosphate etherase [Staphylococcus chromogenes]UXS68372.1 N-acetylmuramic acid 6-phosphate etherase [Staphylococcus chromogenes]